MNIQILLTIKARKTKFGRKHSVCWSSPFQMLGATPPKINNYILKLWKQQIIDTTFRLWHELSLFKYLRIFIWLDNKHRSYSCLYHLTRVAGERKAWSSPFENNLKAHTCMGIQLSRAARLLLSLLFSLVAWYLVVMLSLWGFESILSCREIAFDAGLPIIDC